MSVTDLLNDLRVGWTTVVGLTGTGLGALLEWIPDDIGKLGSVVGLILATVLIRVHLKTHEKLSLEVEELRRKNEAS